MDDADRNRCRNPSKPRCGRPVQTETARCALSVRTHWTWNPFPFSPVALPVLPCTASISPASALDSRGRCDQFSSLGLAVLLERPDLVIRPSEVTEGPSEVLDRRIFVAFRRFQTPRRPRKSLPSVRWSLFRGRKTSIRGSRTPNRLPISFPSPSRTLSKARWF